MLDHPDKTTKTSTLKTNEAPPQTDEVYRLARVV
jgi:hypothetical protein